MFENIIIVTATLIVFFELYRFLRAFWLRRMLEQMKKAKRPRKLMALKPKSERDCRFCQEDSCRKTAQYECQQPEPWNARKGRGGRKKRFSTEGYFCSNSCYD